MNSSLLNGMTRGSWPMGVGTVTRSRCNFLVHAEDLGRGTFHGAVGMDTLLAASCPVLEWQVVVYDFDGGAIAIDQEE